MPRSSRRCTARARSVVEAETVRVSITRTLLPPSIPAAVCALPNVPESVDEICNDRTRSYFGASSSYVVRKSPGVG